MFELIISAHVPKVAGSSFLNQLSRIYGERLLLDYNDDPVNPLSIVNIDPNFYAEVPIETIAPYKAVHGHFHPKKYAKLNNAFRLTFLRHPIDNVLSIYSFWMLHDRNKWDSPLFKYCKDSNLSIVRFAMLPQIRYLYTHSYFGGFDMNHFDFIGDYAKYDEELLRLEGLLDVKFDLNVRVNITAEYADLPLNSTNAKVVDASAEYAKLAEILKDDIHFYEVHKGK